MLNLFVATGHVHYAKSTAFINSSCMIYLKHLCVLGMTESVRHQWVHSMHRCSAAHTTRTILTDLGTKSSEQHEEMGHSRIKRDHEDTAMLVDWFSQDDPFDVNVSGIRSLSTGITATKEDKRFKIF